MRDIKYIGFGLFIGAVIFIIIFLSAIFMPQNSASGANPLFGVRFTPTASRPTDAPVSSPLPVYIPPTNPIVESPTAAPIIPPSPIPAFTSTFTFTPTLIAPVTNTPANLPVFPSATPGIVESMITTGQLAIAGPLSPAQQTLLYTSSLKYIAPAPKEALRISTEINGVRVYPDTTCGPLSIAILKDAGLVSADFNPHDFWLINPDLGKDRSVMKRAFPEDYFEDIRYKVRLDKFDFKTTPLVPGDFLYIYSGTEGNFEHMLVVNRIDAMGRAYSVTNYGTPEGFIINEVLLYDPNDPTAGMFQTWTARPKQKLGSTGYAGFELWRLIAP